MLRIYTSPIIASMIKLLFPVWKVSIIKKEYITMSLDGFPDSTIPDCPKPVTIDILATSINPTLPLKLNAIPETHERWNAERIQLHAPRTLAKFTGIGKYLPNMATPLSKTWLIFHRS
jgi:hypothetical protein